jgi:hypothetical protein
LFWNSKGGPTGLANGPDGSPNSSSTETTTSPPSSPFPTPSPPHHHRTISVANQDFDAIAYYAERAHLRDLAEPERASLQQWQQVHPNLDPCTAFNIPSDPVSRRLAILADTARTGHHSREYAAPTVENIRGYMERAMHLLIHETEEWMMMVHFDEAAMEEADNLVTNLENDLV